MIPYEEALERAHKAVKPGNSEAVSLHAALGRVLAEPFRAAVDSPAFDNSAMDGFGVRCDDLREATSEHPVNLRVVGTVRAGDPASQLAAAPGEAIRIFTGAGIPPGIDAVVMQEHVAFDGGMGLFARPALEGENIRRKGEEYPTGKELLPAGRRLNPAAVALVAANGVPRVAVFRKPKVGIVVTGDELLEPGATPREGQVFECNSFGIAAVLRSAGIEPAMIERVPDDPSFTASAFEKVLGDCDLAISSGGVSVGEYDRVKEVMPRLGVDEVFWGVAIKPGKPVYLGVRSDGRAVLGLPGNPLSVLVTLQMIGMAVLGRIEGLYESCPPAATATMGQTLRKSPGRLEFVPATVDAGRIVVPLEGRGSHMLGGAARANCLIHFPAESEWLEFGDEVKITPLGWGCS